MPNGAASTATARVSWCTAPLVAPYTRAAPPDEPGDRAGVEDDPAATLLLELQHRVLAAVEDAADVDREQALEVLDGVVLERAARGGAWGCRRC